MTTRSLNHRRDSRSPEEFDNDIAFAVRREWIYIEAFLKTYNKRRHKRSLGVLAWGSVIGRITNPSELHKLGRPNFFLLLFKDNSFIVQHVVPLEIHTWADENAKEFPIKAEKFQRGVDFISRGLIDTMSNPDKPLVPYVLCIRGPLDFQHETYYLLLPSTRIYNAMLEQGTKSVSGLGNKSAYSFRTDKVKWRPLYYKHPLQGQFIGGLQCELR